MSENVTTQRVLNQEEMAQLLTIAQFAKLVGASSSTVRKEGKKGNIPGCYHVMGTIGFNPEEAKSWTPPSGSTVRISREDGRLLYSIALLPNTEFVTLTEAGYEIIDPRVAAAAKRELRKAARAEKEAAADAVSTTVAVDVDDEEDIDDDDFFDDTDE